MCGVVSRNPNHCYVAKRQLQEPWRSRKTSRTSEILAPKFISRETLEVRGVCFDRIATISDVLQNATLSPSTLVSIWQFFSTGYAEPAYEEVCQGRAFILALTRGQSYGDAKTWSEQFDVCKGAMRSAIGTEIEQNHLFAIMDPIDIMQNTFFQRLKYVSHDYQLVEHNVAILAWHLLSQLRETHVPSSLSASQLASSGEIQMKPRSTYTWDPRIS